MMTVEESAQATQRYSASKRPPPSDSPMPQKNRIAEHAAADQLAARGEQDDLAGAHDLFQVDFQPDHEQHEDQAEFGDDVLIDSCELTQPMPNGPMTNPAIR